MNVIEIQHVSKSYPGREAVRDISLSIEKGEIFGLIGPNGAGKTTLVEMIAGLRQPDSGQIRVLGHHPRAEKQALLGRVGVQLQESQLPDKIKVWEAVDLFASFYPSPVDWRKLLAALHLEDQRDTVFEKLSGGQKQRLSVALALVGNPEILILDELTTGLDPQARRSIWSLIESIRERGVTIVLVTHFMEEAERLCSRLAVIDSGRVLVQDTPAGIISRAQAEQRLRFRPSEPLSAGLLEDLPEVRQVTNSGSTVFVAGAGGLVQAVTSALARSGIIAHELRIEQSGLDEAFIALTGKKLDENVSGGV